MKHAFFLSGLFLLLIFGGNASLLRQAWSAGPASPDDVLAQALSSEQSGQMAQARMLLSEGLQSYPQDLEIARAFAQLLDRYGQSDRKQAYEQWLKLLPQGQRMADVRASIGRVIFGQDEVIVETLITLLAGGHALLIGVPGLAKTLLVETLGKALGLEDKRIQCTPDLMPADILGSEVLEESDRGRRSFRFIKGPIFCQLLMADEINRASPRTQSALLQAMQEHLVSVAGKSYPLAGPFHVLATQNPLEQEGTYPLPEAQLDRFLLYIKVDYPSGAEEWEIARRVTTGGLGKINPVMSGEQIVESFDAFVEEILTRGEGVHPIFYDSRGTSGEIFKPFAKDVANTDILLRKQLGDGLGIVGHGLAEFIFIEFEPWGTGNSDADGISVGVGRRFGGGTSECDSDLGKPIEPAAAGDRALDHGLKRTLDVRDNGFTKEDTPTQGIRIKFGQIVDIIHGQVIGIHKALDLSDDPIDILLDRDIDGLVGGAV